MNTKNNKKRKNSIIKIEDAFLLLIQEKNLNEITVSLICSVAGLNRSTFYANYLDIYDLADQVLDRLAAEIKPLYASVPYVHRDDLYLRLLTHIFENQLLYKTCFKLNYNAGYPIGVYDEKLAEERFHNQHINYHTAFFRAGFNQIVQMWLESGCRETPEEIAEIIRQEYTSPLKNP